MKAVIELELIGDNHYERRRIERRGVRMRPLHLYDEVRSYRDAPPVDEPSVSRVTWSAERGLETQRLPIGQKDYRDANSIGSRGIRGYWIVDDGVYEVCARESWKRARRYYLPVENGRKREIGREEVYRCLQKSASGSTS